MGEVSPYKIAVVGAGGVGGYFGGKLAANGVATTFVVRGKTLDVLCRDGLRIESINGSFVVNHVNATDKPKEPVDAVLMTVKAWQLREAAETIKPIVREDTIVVPLENGIDGPEQLATVLDNRNVVGGLCAIVSYIVEPGHIRHAAANPFIMFGELDNRRTPRVERLRDVLRSAHVDADVPEDIHKAMWSKFVFIAPMSGIGAATRVAIGVWRTTPETRALAERAILEIIAIAKVRGVELGYEALDATMARYDALPAESTSSLQRDLMSGKPSELDSQLGAAVRLGRENGVPTPVLQTLYEVLLPQERLARR